MKHSSKILSVLMALMMAFSVITTPVQARGGESTNGWGWPYGGWWSWWGWQQPEPEPEPEPTPEVEEPVEDEEPAEDETPADETPAVEEQPVEETPEVTPEPEQPAEPEYVADTLAAPGENYTAYVSFTQEAKIPAGTTAQLTEFAEGSKEYEDAKAAVLGNANGAAGFIAFDISLVNNGTVIEPNGAAVTVSIEMNNLPEEAVAAADTLELTHINEVSGEAEVVATADDITVAEDGTATAEFTVESFSTFTLTWGTNNENSATIVWGYMDGDAFTELEVGSTVTLDTTASTVSLDNTYSGYHYLTTYYISPSNDRVIIDPILTKTSTGWQMKKHVYAAEGDSYTLETADVENGGSIQVVYAEQSTPPSPAPSGNTVPSPITDKHVDDNGDGTYTITLDVEGAEITETTPVGANVLIVLDRTNSMDFGLGNTTRWAAAKKAINTLVSTLTTGQNAGKDVQFSLLDFHCYSSWGTRYNDDVLHSWNPTNGSHQNSGANYWNSFPTEFNNYIQSNSFTTASNTNGTNWESPLNSALTILNTRDADKTFVIFVTDGEPNCAGINRVYTYQSGDVVTPATTRAKAITALNNVALYGVFCGTDDGYRTLNGVMSSAGAVSTVDGSSESAMTEAFQNIAADIVKSMGAENVSVDDGVPSLSNISANVVEGETGGYEYYKKEPTDTDFVKWDDAPGAIYSNDNGVTWDLSNVGVLPEGTKYRIKFTVWPSQAAYDQIADLNNGLRFVDYAAYEASDPDPKLTEEEAIAAGLVLTEKERAGVTGDKQNGYTLVTNTHLNTTYTFKGKEYRDPKTDYQYASMPLPTKKISVKKNWPENLLDPKNYGAAAYRDADGNVQYATEITLNLQKDNADYLPVTVKASDGWQVNDIYVSCGNMSVNGSEVTIHEPGHDYQIIEPAAFSYYWDLISDVYHPMVINGDPVLLVLDEEATSADNVNTYEINGKYYTKHADTDNTLEADNYRRSNLNLTKVVSTEGGQNSYFTYTATVKDANSTDGKVWFSAWDPEADATVKDTDWVLSGATAQEGNTGYWIADNGATVTFKIKAGWNVRFLNLFHGSTFTFEETSMPDYYEFEKAEAKAANPFVDKDIVDADWYSINSKVVTGNIIEPNNSYTVTYTNKYEAFYVYHSGTAVDGNLEVIGMPAAGGTYDLTQNLTANTLYGGYYLDYAGKGDYKDDGIKGTTGVAYTGMNYDWTGAQTVKGTEITPVAGETYYIKEVPTYYLRNYHQINYMKTTKELKALYLISAVDDLNYNETGFYLQTTDKKQATKVVSSLTFKNLATNRSVTLKANNVFKSLGITEDGEYLTYFDATKTQYFAVNASGFTVEPYWITPDGITVKGISARTITITAMTKDGISKVDN